VRMQRFRLTVDIERKILQIGRIRELDISACSKDAAISDAKPIVNLALSLHGIALRTLQLWIETSRWWGCCWVPSSCRNQPRR